LQYLINYCFEIMHKKISVLIIGPSSDYTFGSLLRPLNIWKALSNFRQIYVKYIPIRSISHILVHLRLVVSSEITILSGINPWVSAIVILIRRLLRRKTIVDIHGFAWLEGSILGEHIFKRIILFSSEYLAYRLADTVFTASTWLVKVISQYFKRTREIYVLENSTTYLFEYIVEMLNHIDKDTLRARVEKSLGLQLKGLILLAPLPGIFSANMYALKELMRLGENIEGLILVTGVQCNSLKNIVCLGYVSYVYYVILLLVSDAVILPYPKNAICGGARNKVLEALYLSKPIVSTPTGMMHINAKPGIHYILVEDIKSIKNIKMEYACSTKTLESLRNRHVFKRFKRELLQVVTKHILIR